MSRTSKRKARVRKPGVISTLRATVVELNAAVDRQCGVISDFQRKFREMEIQLDEARRRTLPIGAGSGPDSEMNFLPLWVESVEMRHEFSDVQSMSGPYKIARGPATAIIHARGDVVYFPAPKR